MVAFHNSNELAKMSHSSLPNKLNYDVFVSYSRMDGPFVELLVRKLESFAPPKALGLP